MFRSAFPGLQISVEDQIQESAQAVTRFTIHGTHKGDLMSIPATGKKFKVSGISIIRFGHGGLSRNGLRKTGFACCNSKAECSEEPERA
jgi:predicted ester cyclase